MNKADSMQVAIVGPEGISAATDTTVGVGQGFLCRRAGRDLERTEETVEILNLGGWLEPGLSILIGDGNPHWWALVAREDC